MSKDTLDECGGVNAFLAECLADVPAEVHQVNAFECRINFAKAVGIPEEYNFSRWFKIITGMTANEWRVKSYQKTPLSD